MRITAQEARKLSGETLDEKIDMLLESVKAAAKEGKRSLRTSWDHEPHQDLWVKGGYNRTEEWEKACGILRDLGYTVTFYYSETQFVDMYTLIQW